MKVHQGVERGTRAQNWSVVFLPISLLAVSTFLGFVLLVVLPRAKDQAAAQAQVIVIDNLRHWHEIEREHDVNSSTADPYQSDRDRVMRGIGRLRSAVRLKMAIIHNDGKIYKDEAALVQKEIENEIKHLAPIVYRLQSREVFMDFGEAMNAADVQDPVEVLGAQYFIELAKAK